MEHLVQRVRHDTKRRSAKVGKIIDLSPNMKRIVLEGPDLEGFLSLGPDDHMKLLIPSAHGEPIKRDYTPRKFDPAARTLTVDFALHDAGPVTSWAMKAKIGDEVVIGGPRGSMVVPWTFDWWLLVGDETALPAIGRRVEEAPAGTRIFSFTAIQTEADKQTFETKAEYRAEWVLRPEERAADPAPLLEALARFSPPPGDGFVWVAAEAGVARAIRDHVRTRLNHPPAWTRMSGYWAKGHAEVHDNLKD